MTTKSITKSNDAVSESSSVKSQSSSQKLDSSSSKSLTSKSSAVPLGWYDAATTTRLQWPRWMGREKERQYIHDAISRVVNKQQSEVLMIQGESGVGKSVIARMAMEEATTMEYATGSIVCAVGKYEHCLEDGSCRPFAAIVDATTELCYGLSPTTKSNIRESFSTGELLLLSSVFPVIHEFGLANTGDDGAQDIEPSREEQRFVTFLRLYRKLLSIICNDFTCVVLLIDDIQWSDDVSRKLLKSILTDVTSNLNNLLFLFTQRKDSNEQYVEIESLCPTNILELNCLNSSEVNDIISIALGMKPDETKELSDLVYRRGFGNTYHIIQYVECVFACNLIRDCSDHFEWDVKEIAARTKSSSNVVDILVKKLSSVPFETRVALIVASHLGFKFNAQVLQELFEDTDLMNLFAYQNDIGVGRYMMIVNGGLERVCQLGLVEKVAGLEFQFVHDRVQEAARHMLPKGKDGEKIMVRLGELLLQRLISKQRDPATLFSTIRILLKYPSPSTSKETIAEFCLEAAKAAKKQSVYERSAKYAQRGLKLIENSGWKRHYSLCLDLHCIAADMCHASGNWDQCKVYVTKIDENALSDTDKFTSQKILLDVLSEEADWPKCILTCRRYLTSLGVRFPKKANQLNVASNLLQAKSLLRGRTANDLSNLESTSDPKIIHAIEILATLAEAGFQDGDDAVCACAALRILHLVLEHGVSDKGVYAFAAYAVCLSHLGSIAEAVTFFGVAKKLSSSRVHVLVHTFPVIHLIGSFLSTPVLQSPVDLRRAYESAVSIGSVYRASINLRMALAFEFYVGNRLPQLEEKSAFCKGFFKDYSELQSYKVTAPTMQMIECLQGRTKSSISLSGTYMCDEDVYQVWDSRECRNSNYRMLVIEVHYCRNFLFLVHSRLDLIKAERKRYGKVKEEMGSYYRKLLNCFHCAIAYYGLALEQRKYLRIARQLIREIRRHAVAGSPMLNTMLVMADAEEASFRGESSMADDLFKRAAREFEEQSLFWYKAIALERAAKYVLRREESSIVGMELLAKAYDEYERQGAWSKTELLEAEYPSIRSSNGRNVPQSICRPEAAPVG